MKKSGGKKEYEKDNTVYKVNEPAAAYVSKPVVNMLSKSTVINSVKDLPNKFTIDELIERILLIQSTEKVENKVNTKTQPNKKTGLSAQQLAELDKRVQNHKKMQNRKLSLESFA